jgi:hypothetical protein
MGPPFVLLLDDESLLGGSNGGPFLLFECPLGPLRDLLLRDKSVLWPW